MANTEDSFEALLSWLDSDRNKAGEKYELIRAGLIRRFISKGFSDAEDLADQTMNVVMVRLPDIRDNYVGPKAKYFHGVARNISWEAGRRKELATDVFPIQATTVLPNQASGTSSNEYQCLIKCLGFLPPPKRELILDYHLYQGKAKIEHHQILANELQVSKGALRTRAHHIRVTLEKCVLDCTRDLTVRERNATSRSYLSG